MSKKDSLLSSEWFLIISFLAIFLSLALVARVQSQKANHHLLSTAVTPQESILSVTLEGAVGKPGLYLVPKGTPLKEVLRKARPKPHADFSSVDLERPLDAPLHLVVERLAQLLVRVEGAVLEPQQLTLPPGTRICDVKKLVSLAPDADKAFFRKKRQLKNGEILVVPKKTVE